MKKIEDLLLNKDTVVISHDEDGFCEIFIKESTLSEINKLTGIPIKGSLNLPRYNVEVENEVGEVSTLSLKNILNGYVKIEGEDFSSFKGLDWWDSLFNSILISRYVTHYSYDLNFNSEYVR